MSFSPCEWDLDLAKVRRSAGLSQGQLAERLGVTQQAVSSIECAESDPSYRLLFSWLVACGVEIGLKAKVK